MRARIAGIALPFFLLVGCSSQPLSVWNPGSDVTPPCPDRVARFVVTHTTAQETDADTSNNFELRVRIGRDTCMLDFPKRSGARSLGRQDRFELGVGYCSMHVGDVTPGEVFLHINGNNAWLPSFLKVEMQTESGEVRTIAEGRWPSDNWFSTDEGDCRRPDRCQETWAVSTAVP